MHLTAMTLGTGKPWVYTRHVVDLWLFSLDLWTLFFWETMVFVGNHV